MLKLDRSIRKIPSLFVPSCSIYSDGASKQIRGNLATADRSDSHEPEQLKFGNCQYKTLQCFYFDFRLFIFHLVFLLLLMSIFSFLGHC